MNGAQALLQTLVNCGVEVCFGNPGTSVMHFVAALDAIPGMRPVLCLFEGVATGAADGYGRMAEKPAALDVQQGLENTIKFLRDKFGKKPEILESNIKVLQAGYNYGDTTETFTTTYTVEKAKMESGTYRSIMGNQAVAYGLIAAAQKSGLQLFLGSYPITPASDILHDLSKYKNFGVKTFQAEDEIAAIASAIGASYGGALGVTTSSGPGIALKGEAMGLAVMLEIPLVIINIQRGGPSTGLPTKTEQSDLMQAWASFWTWRHNGPLQSPGGSRWRCSSGL